MTLEDFELVPLYEADAMSEISPSIEFATVLSEYPSRKHYDEDKKDWVLDDPVGYMLKPRESPNV